MPGNLPRHQRGVLPQSLWVESWMGVRLVVDRGTVADALFVFNTVGSAVLIFAPFDKFQGGIDSTGKHPGL